MTEPTNATEAQAALDARTADKGWSDRYINGGSAERQEFQQLTSKIASGGDDVVDAALKGSLTTPAGFVSSDHQLINHAVALFRDLGIRDDVIKQTLNGQEVTQAEYDTVKRWKADRMRDSEWVKKYLAGEGEHKREMMLADIVLSSSIKKDAAA
jgi:hypothetical protein